MIEIIRRLFVVILWVTGLVFATGTSFYFATITEVAGGEGEMVAGFAIGAIIFLVIIGITYFIHKKILNYIFMVDNKKDGKKAHTSAN